MSDLPCRVLCSGKPKPAPFFIGSYIRLVFSVAGFRLATYDNEFRRRTPSLGMKEVISAPRSPWQNAFVERMIGSIRRECLDHVVVLSQRHLRNLLKRYFTYYHRSRTHLALAKDAPESRAIMNRGVIVAIPQVGGLHRRYERRAA